MCTEVSSRQLATNNSILIRMPVVHFGPFFAAQQVFNDDFGIVRGEMLVQKLYYCALL